mmetsp:Transcript_14386/g.17103  ORF Transcript_14386/g.17103 Transcript_14386/m.17103 type:complete len:274 (-) Transcript_14386:187-1008(-)
MGNSAVSPIPADSESHIFVNFQKKSGWKYSPGEKLPKQLENTLPQHIWDCFLTAMEETEIQLQNETITLRILFFLIVVSGLLTIFLGYFLLILSLVLCIFALIFLHKIHVNFNEKNETIESELNQEFFETGIILHYHVSKGCWKYENCLFELDLTQMKKEKHLRVKRKKNSVTTLFNNINKDIENQRPQQQSGKSVLNLFSRNKSSFEYRNKIRTTSIDDLRDDHISENSSNSIQKGSISNIFAKSTSTELQKQIIELEPIEEPLKRVSVINT